jgi:hypothetical protein
VAGVVPIGVHRRSRYPNKHRQIAHFCISSFTGVFTRILDMR